MFEIGSYDVLTNVRLAAHPGVSALWRQMKARVSALLGVWLLLAAAPLYAAAKSAVPAGTRIPIDLTTPFLDAVLPFDVRFVFTGNTPSGVVEIGAAVVDITYASKSQQPAIPGRNRFGPAFACPATSARVWLPLNAIMGSGGTFAIQVPRLEANHYYCFAFVTKKKLDATALLEFRQKAALAFSDRLRQVDDLFKDLDDIKNLRQEFIRAVTPADTGTRLQVRTGSIFEQIDLAQEPARKTELDDIEEKFQATLLPLRQAQLNHNNTIATFLTKADDTNSELLRLFNPTDTPGFVRVKNALAVGNTNLPVAIAALVANARPILDRLTKLSSADLVLLGLAGPRQTKLEMESWTATEITSRTTALGTLKADLATVLADLVKIDTPARVNQVGNGVTRADLDAVQNQLKVLDDRLTIEIAVLRDMQGAIDARQAAIVKVVADLDARIVSDIVILGTSVGDFSTRHNTYLSADLGFAWAWDLDEMFPYAGMNIYFRPVNKDAPLSEFGSFAASFTRRFSAMVGISVATDVAKAGQSAALFGDRVLLLGAGIRLNDSLRFAGGAVILKSYDPNPLIDHQVIRASPFISFSVDWNVRDAFLNLGSNAANPGAGLPQVPAAPAAPGATPQPGPVTP
jgi:hypothetical protein